MASTNSTRKSSLNYHYVLDDMWYKLYGNVPFVNTGNIKDKDPSIKNDKYVPNTRFNNTYTMGKASCDDSKIEETGVLRNYYDYMLKDDYVYVWGHPDKWIYDTDQKYNNCGIVSALNVLSMAGKIDVVAPTKPEIDDFSKPYPVTETDIFTGETTTKMVTPKIDFTSSEELLTLYAIKHDYAIHSRDLANYKSIKDIKKEDGGTYFSEVYSEEHTYHDTTQCVTSILNDYGVKSSVKPLAVTIRPEEENDIVMEEKAETEKVTVSDGNGGTKEIEIKKDLVCEFTIKSGDYNYNYVVTSVAGSDTLIFEDLNLSDFDYKNYVLTEDGRDLVIYHTDTNYVKIKNFYHDVNNPGSDDLSHITTIKFKDGTTISADEFAERYTHYSSKLLTSNLAKYGDFITYFLDIIKEGKGIVISGDALSLKGKNDSGRYVPHAMTLAGIQFESVLKKDMYEINDTTGHTLYDFDDSAGFYVVDSGGWLPNNGKAQFINVEQMYNFLTRSTYNKSKGVYYSRNYSYVETNDNIKKWADDLNLNGNERRNTLIGNEGKNILNGYANADNLYGRGGDDTLYGGSGNDWLSGGAGNNVLNGGSGNDTYVFSSEDDKGAKQVVRPGKGADRLRFGYSQDDVMTKFDESLYKTLADDYSKFLPKDQVDELLHDYKLLKVSDLTYYNKDGNLIIDYLYDRTVNVKDYFKKDLYTSISKIDDTDTIAKRQKDNKDHAYDFVATLKEKGINYKLDKTQANNVKGSKFKDIITTTVYDDTIISGSGNDVIYSMLGNDVIKSGKGNDVIVMGYGNKQIYGEKGTNRIAYKDNFGGYDTIHSGKGKDYIYLTSKTRNDLMFSKKGNDLVVTYDKNTGSSITVTDYFSNKGNTSVKSIKLKDGDYLDLIKEYSSVIKKKCAANKTAGRVGGNGNDSLRGNSGDNFITGGMGDDVITAGYGDDTVIGGLGSDIIYTNGGNDTFVYETLYDGNDSIYSANGGNITLDFTNIQDLSLNGRQGFVDGYKNDLYGDKNYAYTKSGNDLIIDYAKTVSQEDMSTIRLVNYFKSKTKYTIKTASGNLKLSKATLYFEGKYKEKNTIVGSRQSDLIYGGKYKDNIKAGKGADIIIGGRGNDNIAGGKGHNRIVYNNGDGIDVINLTKGEKLDIVLDKSYDANKLSYKISKNNLIISHANSDKLVLKNFGKTDITGATGQVKLYIGDDFVMDLRKGVYLPKYKSFTSKKLSYTGDWHSEVIDASKLSKSSLANNDGVVIKGKSGHDIITGSKYNDVISGGYGNDIINGGSGLNKLNGNSGNDTYILFNNVKNERTTISDSGSSTNDTALVYTDKSNFKLWFNIDNEGNKSGAITIKSTDNKGNVANLKGVEVIKSVSDAGTYCYNLKSNELRQEVAAWLNGSGHKYADVNAAMSKATANQINELIAIFNKSDYWTPSV